MNQLQTFNHPMFGDVRFVEINNNTHAVGNDVAKVLGYSRPHEAISNHCKWAVTYRILTNGGEQTVKVIPEADIYRLIVKAADQSKNQEIRRKAEEFEKWIVEVVLPTIRKTGGYVANADYFDFSVDRKFLKNFRDTAKELKINERLFIDWLLLNNFVYRDQKGKLKPYAAYVPELFKLKKFVRNGKADVQILITPKGRWMLQSLLQKEVTSQ